VASKAGGAAGLALQGRRGDSPSIGMVVLSVLRFAAFWLSVVAIWKISSSDPGGAVMSNSLPKTGTVTVTPPPEGPFWAGEGRGASVICGRAG
jgi:hypothetical protein